MHSELQSPKLKQTWVLPPTWLRFLIVVLLILGVFFRFVNLDRKVYWGDEAYTSLRISGYTVAEVVKQVFDSHEIGIEDLQKYQRTNPEKGLVDTVKGLAVEEPQHAPLYFVMARFWVQWFGNSVAVTRSLSALISLLVFPCLYWLCVELFKSSLTGWVAIALMAVSPFHVLYAQEAREYSLWTVTILLSSAALLRAMRLKTKLSWGMYTATLALGLYSFLLTGLVAISHGVYVIATERFRLSKTVIAYLLASFAGLLTFVPWLAVIIANSTAAYSTAGAGKVKTGTLILLKDWISNIRVIFLDLNFSPYCPGWHPVERFGAAFLVGYSIFFLFILILVGYSIYFLCRKTPKQVWLFILTLIGGVGLALSLPDLIFGGARSTVDRYLIPCYLGFQLAVAHLLATQTVFASSLRRKIWQVIMVVLISGGAVSCIIISQTYVSWSKYHGCENPQVAHIINQATRPLLLSEASVANGNLDSNWNVGQVISLSYLLDPKVRFLLVVEPNIPKVTNGFSDVFLYDPSQGLRYGIETEQNYKIKPVDKLGDNLLLKLEKQ